MQLAVRWTKKGILKYISHLDVVRLLQRSVRRAFLPVRLSQGWTPCYKISFNNALKLGLESENERAVFHLERWISPEEFKLRINEQLPEGIKVAEALPLTDNL